MTTDETMDSDPILLSLREKMRLDDERDLAQMRYDVEVEDCECACPDSYRLTNIPSENCPRHGLVCDLAFAPAMTERAEKEQGT